MTHQHYEGGQESENGRRIAHEIEHKLAHGHNLKSTLHEEIHTLRQLDSTHGKLNHKQFQGDLKAVDHELHQKHLLPHLHIVSHGEHLGQLVSDSRQLQGHHSLQHGGLVPESGRASHKEKCKPHTVVPESSSASDRPAHERPHSGLSPRGTPDVPAPMLPPQQQTPDTPAPMLPPQQQTPDIPAPILPTQKLAPDNMEPRQSNDRPFAPAPVLSAGELGTLKSDIERARSGGRPLTIAQIGDSHVKFGMETPALAARLAADTGLQAGQVSYSSVGDVGKTASYANEHPGEFLAKINRNTDLVVVSFGSNEAGGPVGGKYLHDYASLIQKIRGRAPQAAIVMVGPTDGNYWNSSRHLPYLDAVAAAQQRVAANVPDSTYLKIGPQMGSVAAMRQNGLMASDNLHLTARGYQKLGSIIADDISAVLRQ